MGVASQAAIAAPIVSAGSEYSIYLAGSESDNAFTGIVTFDDEAASAYRETGTLTVSESETIWAMDDRSSVFKSEALAICFRSWEKRRFLASACSISRSN